MSEDIDTAIRKLNEIRELKAHSDGLDATRKAMANAHAVTISVVEKPGEAGLVAGARPVRLMVTKDSAFWSKAMAVVKGVVEENQASVDKRAAEATEDTK